MVGMHSSQPIIVLLAKSSPRRLRNSFLPPGGCHIHSCPVTTLRREMILAPNAGTKASSNASLRKKNTSKPCSRYLPVWVSGVGVMAIMVQSPALSRNTLYPQGKRGFPWNHSVSVQDQNKPHARGAG